MVALVYIQLIVGNWMRHSESGLAVPDFPTMGGALIPTMDHAMLNRINAWRFENNLEPVTMMQVYIHLLHRFCALLILLVLFYINHFAIRKHLDNVFIMKTLFWINIAVGIQIMLGISTVLLKEEPIITTIHVTVGALVLAMSFLLLLRSSPCFWGNFLQQLKSK
ncbi:MAG: COX15/CtaA family protein [Candidatus Omnitrophica bacterium]|nr:COX15/CtaA family protein [Candidatus Omnitrophota bacterium]